MNIKAILFDLDDTLYDYSSVHKDALKNTHNVFNDAIPMDYEEFVRLYEATNSQVKRELSGTASSHNRIIYFQKMIESTHNTVKPRLIMSLYHAYWDYLVENMELRPDAMQVLQEIKGRGIKTAIVSDLTTYIQIRKIIKLEIGDYIDLLVTSEEAGTDKPHPYMFLLALHKLNTLTTEALMVGDNPTTDIEGAKTAGIRSIQLLAGDSNKEYKEESRKPDYKINELTELIPLLDSLS